MTGFMLRSPEAEESAPAMALNVAKLALLIGLSILTLGVIPDRRKGAVIAIATCIAAAVFLHFAAP